MDEVWQAVPVIVGFSFSLILATALFATDSPVRRIEIESRWRGLGEPQQSRVLIRNKKGTFLRGRTRAKNGGPGEKWGIVGWKSYRDHRVAITIWNLDGTNTHDTERHWSAVGTPKS